MPEIPLRQSESASDQNVLSSESLEPEEKGSSDEETQVIQVKEHPRSSGQEMTKRQREVLDDYPVEAFKRQSTAPAVLSTPTESRAPID
eukprot:3784540-Karenia_brevis.AAC.1